MEAENTEEEMVSTTRWPWHVRLAVGTAKLLASAAFVAYVLFWGGRYTERAWAMGVEVYWQKRADLARWLDPTTPPPPSMPSDDRTLDAAIEKAAKEFGFPAMVMRAVAMQESRDGSPLSLYAFEEGRFQNPDFQRKHRGLTVNERRMMASSHGPMHVMGENALPLCGVHWHQLYDIETGVRCGAKILRANWDTFADVKPKTERLFLTLRAYNGSLKLPATEAYANKVMGHLGTLLASSVMEREETRVAKAERVTSHPRL